MKEGDGVYAVSLSEQEKRKLQIDSSVGRQTKGHSAQGGRWESRGSQNSEKDWQSHTGETPWRGESDGVNRETAEALCGQARGSQAKAYEIPWVHHVAFLRRPVSQFGKDACESLNIKVPLVSPVSSLTPSGNPRMDLGTLTFWKTGAIDRRALISVVGWQSGDTHCGLQFSIWVSLLPRCLSGKESAANAGTVGDVGLIPGSGRFPEGGNDNLLLCSCLENAMVRESLQATIHGVAKSQTWLSKGFDPQQD